MQRMSSHSSRGSNVSQLSRAAEITMKDGDRMALLTTLSVIIKEEILASFDETPHTSRTGHLHTKNFLSGDNARQRTES